MKSACSTNSRYITHTIAFWKVARIHFLSSRVKGLSASFVSLFLFVGTFRNYYTQISCLLGCASPQKLAQPPAAPSVSCSVSHSLSRSMQQPTHRTIRWSTQYLFDLPGNASGLLLLSFKVWVAVLLDGGPATLARPIRLIQD